MKTAISRSPVALARSRPFAFGQSAENVTPGGAFAWRTTSSASAS
jgi:hypothetical protein